MRENPLRILAILFILIAYGTLVLAMVVGGDIWMIVFGLALAATSMKLFSLALPRHDNED
jgi:uncharacterized membrane protein